MAARRERAEQAAEGRLMFDPELREAFTVIDLSAVESPWFSDPQ